MEVAEVRRFPVQEEENRKRKQLVTDRCLDKRMLQDVYCEKPLKPAQLRPRAINSRSLTASA